MSTPFELTRLAVGDVIERTITLLRMTFSRIGLIFVVLAVPAALLFGVVMDGFFASMMQAAVADSLPGSVSAFVASLLKWVVIVTLAALVLIVVELIALVSMQIIVCGEIVGRHVDTREAFELTMGVRLWRAVGQRLLAELMVGLVVLLPFWVVASAVAANMGGVAILAMALAVMFALVCVVYLKVRWAFGTTTIAWEDESVLGAFGRSSELVRGSWLRTLGILALFAIVVGMIVSLLLTPVQLVVFKDLLVAGFSQARNVAFQSQPEVAEALSGMGFLYGISVAFASLGKTLLQSVYLPVLYFDLRSRTGEFDSE